MSPPLAVSFCRLKAAKRIVESIESLPGPEKLGPNFFVHRIPDFNGNKHMSTHNDRKQPSLNSKIRHFTMHIFILDQRSDLAVDHSVELCDQDYMVSVFSMLREERKPPIPALLAPLPSVKDQLTFVYYQQNRIFLDRFSLPERCSIRYKKIRRELVV